jgi:transposase InsO family protein
LNIPADTLSRCSAILHHDREQLKRIHNGLCHPGVTRVTHYVRSKNLPYSENDVKTVSAKCPICCEIKPRFFMPPVAHTVRATAPFERLQVDFKGPLPGSGPNKYILTVVDEFSRYPFAFPCRDTSAKTVIACLNQIFMIFGSCSFIHSDRGSAFISKELRQYLLSQNIAVSLTSPYNPKSNGQCERYNSIIWQGVELALKSQGLPITRWESVIPFVLHSIRSLLCTSTGETPHERAFLHKRRSLLGQTLPTWMLNPGIGLLKLFDRQS